MAGLVDYAILNGIDNDLTSSIEYTGGDPTPAVGVVDLAAIIKEQLITNKAVGEGVYDKWLFGTPDTNQIFEDPTESSNAVQASTIANSMKQLYELMTNTERFVVYLVNELPTNEISLSAIYLLKESIVSEIFEEDTTNEPVREQYIYSAHYYVKEGKNLKRIDVDELKIDINQLFYVAREEFLENQAKIENYYEALEKTIKTQLGSYLEGNDVSLDETIKALQKRCDDIDAKFKEYVKWSEVTVASHTKAGWMSAADKRKLDSIDTITQQDLDETLIM